MIKFNRVYAVFYKYMIAYRKNLDPLLASIYMPVLDLILWGITAKWLTENSPAGAGFYKVILTALVLWHIIDRLISSISLNFLEEIWSTHLASMFATPLKIYEWIIGVLMLGAISCMLTLIIGATAAFLFYQVNIFNLGWKMLPFLLTMILFGWSLGFLVTGIVAGFGTRLQSFAWYIAFLVSPFSAIYYPVDVLPAWAQAISSAMPSAYVFEGLREVLLKGTFNLPYFLSALSLDIIYLGLSMFFFIKMFEKRRVMGLSSFS